MADYTCEPNLEIPGHTAYALLESINRENYLHVLEKHGFADIEQSTDIWYPLQDLLNILNDMGQNGRATMDFVSIGMAGGANSIIPPE